MDPLPEEPLSIPELLCAFDFLCFFVVFCVAIPVPALGLAPLAPGVVWLPLVCGAFDVWAIPTVVMAPSARIANLPGKDIGDTSRPLDAKDGIHCGSSTGLCMPYD